MIRDVELTKLKYRKVNYDALREFVDKKINTTDFKSVTDVNQGWEMLLNIINDGISKFVPRVRSMSWQRNPNWRHPVSKNMKNLIRRKHRLWTRYRETHDPKLERKYNAI